VRFEDAVRVGDVSPPMRSFDGVENVVQPGIASPSPDKLLAAAAARSEAFAPSPDVADSRAIRSASGL